MVCGAASRGVRMGGWPKRRDDHQLFVIDQRLFEWASVIGSGSNAASSSPDITPRGQILLAASRKFKPHIRIALVKFVHAAPATVIAAVLSIEPSRRQAARRGIVNGVARFLRKIEQTIGIVEQQLAGGRRLHALAFADEQRRRQDPLRADAPAW